MLKPVKTLFVVAAAAAALGVAGCSSPPPAAPEVATLESGSPSAPPSSGGEREVEAERPRERLDMTPEESERMWVAHNDCLDETGLRPKGGGGEGPAPGGPPGEVSAGAAVSPEAEQAAYRACLSKEPLPPWEYDVANPEAGDFAQALVECLRAKGVRYVEASAPQGGENRYSIALGGDQNDSASISSGLDLIPQCEKDLLGGGR